MVEYNLLLIEVVGNFEPLKFDILNTIIVTIINKEINANTTTKYSCSLCPGF